LPSRRLSLAAALAATLAVVLLVAGCGTAASPSPSAAPTAAAPVIANAWVRPPMGMDRPAAGYLSITNPGGVADALIAASSAVASRVEIHETVAGESGMTGMRPVARIDVPAGTTVELKPGGYHLMLMGVSSLQVGGTVQLELTFEKAGKVTVTAEVKNG
jgi:copper(I)-binding protein